MPKLFVYGEARKGRDYYNKEMGQPVFQQAWLQGKLFVNANGLPVVMLEEGQYIYGEVYDLSKYTLHQLRDRIEQIAKNEELSIKQQSVVVGTDHGTEEAVTFVVTSSDGLTATDVQDWPVYQLLKTNDIFSYFAYGSCMDHDRFQKAGIDHGFKKVLGRGIVAPYQVKFTMNGPAGGAADLVEEQGEAEGVVYEVDQETLNYLWVREGVEAGWYRPAVIYGELNGELQPFLTFIVKNKHPERQPSIIYATEILRGAKVHLSEGYIMKLKKKLKDEFNMTIDDYLE